LTRLRDSMKPLNPSYSGHARDSLADVA
jgi:hypothetical protein